MSKQSHSHGSLESDSSDDEDGDQIEFHLDGHIVLLSTKTTFYLTRVVDLFSTYFIDILYFYFFPALVCQF